MVLVEQVVEVKRVPHVEFGSTSCQQNIVQVTIGSSGVTHELLFLSIVGILS